MYESARASSTSPDRLPAGDYPADARVIASMILPLHPTAAVVAFDTYDDDDTMDCGPLIDADGRTILDDVSDAVCGLDIERLVSRWTRSGFFAADRDGFAVCPRTGRPQVLLRRFASPGAQRSAA